MVRTFIKQNKNETKQPKQQQQNHKSTTTINKQTTIVLVCEKKTVLRYLEQSLKSKVKI